MNKATANKILDTASDSDSWLTLTVAYSYYNTADGYKVRDERWSFLPKRDKLAEHYSGQTPSQVIEEWCKDALDRLEQVQILAVFWEAQSAEDGYEPY